MSFSHDYSVHLALTFIITLMDTPTLSPKIYNRKKKPSTSYMMMLPQKHIKQDS